MIAARTDLLAGWQVTIRKTIARRPQDIFALLTDVERMAGLGPEHFLARWLTESRETGERSKESTASASTWTYTLEATNGGAGDATTVTQTFEHGPGQSLIRRAVELAPAAGNILIAARTRQLRHNMNATLQQVEVQLIGAARGGTSPQRVRPCYAWSPPWMHRRGSPPPAGRPVSRLTGGAAAQPGRSSGRLAASLPCSRPVDWPTSMRYPSGSRM